MKPKDPKGNKRFLIISIIIVIILAIIGYVVTSMVQGSNNSLPVREGTGQEGDGNSTIDSPE